MPQSLSSILVHLVFSIKHRKPLLQPAHQAELHPYMATVFRSLDCPSLAIGGTADHIHALFRLGRTKTVADVVEEVKVATSKWLKTKGPTLRYFHWQNGYGAFSIGESGVNALRRYIAAQEEHHRRLTFQDEFRAILKKYRIPYDERYAWD
jgi:REP element-mobilizing transposase RayT